MGKRKSFNFDTDEVVDSSRTKTDKKMKNAKHSKITAKSETAMKKIDIRPKTDNQQKLWDALDTKVLTIVSGPAGSGKTYLSAYFAAQALKNKEVEHIFITRTMITVGKDIGFLPGNETDKMLPYVAPIIEYFSEFFSKEEVSKMLKAGVIRVVPVGLLRGYTFKDTFVILDEAQNTTPHEFKTIITRIGEGSKMVVLGDLEQSDLPKSVKHSGPEDFIRRMNDETDLIGVVKLTEDDVMRSDLVKDIIRIYKEEVKD